MAFTDVLLIVLILLVVYSLTLIACKGAETAGQAKAPEAAALPLADKPKVNTTAAAAEAFATRENYEYFESQCSTDAQLGPSVNACDCPSDALNTYAKAEYGPSGDYTTWIMNQSIDPTVAANHKEFISDRTGENSSVNTLGRTYTPEDSHQSYTPPNTWIGIRGRPSLVPVCSPDQVNDVNFGYYPKDQKLKWDSSSTYAV